MNSKRRVSKINSSTVARVTAKLSKVTQYTKFRISQDMSQIASAGNKIGDKAVKHKNSRFAPTTSRIDGIGTSRKVFHHTKKGYSPRMGLNHMFCEIHHRVYPAGSKCPQC